VRKQLRIRVMGPGAGTREVIDRHRVVRAVAREQMPEPRIARFRIRGQPDDHRRGPTVGRTTAVVVAVSRVLAFSLNETPAQGERKAR